MGLPLNKTFILPKSLNASEPPEIRGLRRDQVKLMVTDKRSRKLEHTQFNQLDQYLQSGDVLILNNSRTIPAVVKGDIMRKGKVVAALIEIRFAKKYKENCWDLLVLHEDIEIGDMIIFSEGQLKANILEKSKGTPLWRGMFDQSDDCVMQYLYKNGQPIRYEYIKDAIDLSFYQTVYATVPGSVEMPSAGRAFTWELLFKLQRKGVKLEFIQLHTGLSFLLEEYWPLKPDMNPEIYRIEAKTMDVIHQAKKRGSKVVAVGTTVVRALETAMETKKNEGLTNLYIGPDYRLKIVDGILTGLHEPEASHLDMLSAFVDSTFLLSSYEEAIHKGYLWHEFGDLNLII